MTILPCLRWFIDMNRGGQAPIIHEEPVQRQLGSVVRAGSINEWACGGGPGQRHGVGVHGRPRVDTL